MSHPAEDFPEYTGGQLDEGNSVYGWVRETLHQLDLTIALAKVNTEGQSVADVFYVSDADGNKVHDYERLKRLQRVLYDRILALHAGAEGL